MNAFSKVVLAVAMTLSSVSLATAQDSHPGGVAGQMVDGEVKKVDRDTGKITIRHGELKNLGMPAMTMVFGTKDRAMLEQVKAGDKVKFVAEKVNSTLTVVQLETVK